MGGRVSSRGSSPPPVVPCIVRVGPVVLLAGRVVETGTVNRASVSPRSASTIIRPAMTAHSERGQWIGAALRRLSSGAARAWSYRAPTARPAGPSSGEQCAPGRRPDQRVSLEMVGSLELSRRIGSDRAVFPVSRDL